MEMLPLATALMLLLHSAGASGSVFCVGPHVGGHERHVVGHVGGHERHVGGHVVEHVGHVGDML